MYVVFTNPAKTWKRTYYETTVMDSNQFRGVHPGNYELTRQVIGHGELRIEIDDTVTLAGLDLNLTLDGQQVDSLVTIEPGGAHKLTIASSTFPSSIDLLVQAQE